MNVMRGYIKKAVEHLRVRGVLSKPQDDAKYLARGIKPRVYGNCYIDDSVIVGSKCTFQGLSGGKVVLGNGTVIGDRTMLLSGKGSDLVIGDNVRIESDVCLVGPSRIESGSIVDVKSRLIACNIGKNSVISARGNLRKQDVPENQMWGGSPTTFIRDLTEEEIEKGAQSLRELRALAAELKSIDVEMKSEDVGLLQKKQQEAGA